MIITNGTYSYLQATATAGGVDEHGRKLPASTKQWSEPAPCCIQNINDNRRGTYEDGRYRNASFYVFTELQPFPHKRITLIRGEEELGEFNVLSAEPLTAVGCLRIMVSKQ